MVCACVGPCGCGYGVVGGIGLPGLFLTSGRVTPPELYEAGEQVVYPVTSENVSFQSILLPSCNFAQTFSVRICETSIISIQSTAGTANASNVGGLHMSLDIRKVEMGACNFPCVAHIQVLVRGEVSSQQTPIKVRKVYKAVCPLQKPGFCTQNYVSVFFNGDEYLPDTLDATIYIKYKW